MTQVSVARQGQEARPRRDVFFRPGWWLIPLRGIAILLVAAFLATVVMSLRKFETGIIIYDQWTGANYARFIFDRYYLRVLGTTTFVGVFVVFLTLAFGYAPAYFIARAKRGKGLLIALTITPIFIPSVIRVFSWTYMLGASGLVNSALEGMGLIDLPLALVYNRTGTIIGLTHVFLPFMILSLLASMEKIDPILEEAAEGLGASRWRVLRRIVLPLSLPGVAAGSLLVFTLCVASYITPAMLGSRRDPVIAETIFDIFSGAGNWPFGTAIAMLVLVYALAAIVLYMRLMQREDKALSG
jgi:putative spermidine/putrescine transport system permease protein